MKYIESERIELKEILKDSLEKEIIGFLNCLGGNVLVGVNKKGIIVGVDDPDTTALKIADRLKNNIAPSPTGLFNINIKEDDSDGKKKYYIDINVASGLEKPYYLKRFGMTPNGCSIRIGTQTTQMPQSQIDSLFSSRVINTLHNVISPNQYLTFAQLKIYYQEKGYDVNNEYFLKNLGLYTEDGKYNYVAYLMADNNGNSVKVAKFKGTDKLDIVERNEYGRCCLIKSVYSVLEKLEVMNTTVVRVGGEARRKEYRLVNKDALRECVLNSILHNDYINGAYPVFEIYDDRIEIVSSGGLPIGLSKEEFFSGRSLPRNKELMRIFSDMELCEQLGSGMRKIMKYYTPDDFEITEHFIIAKFKYDEEALKILGKQNDSENVGVNVGVNLSLNKTQKIMLKLIIEDNNITYLQLSEKLNKSEETIRRNIKILKAKGIIERIGSDKTGYWKVNQ